MADNDWTKVEEIKETALTDIMMFLVYLKDKAIADRAQNEMDEQIRKAKRRK